MSSYVDSIQLKDDNQRLEGKAKKQYKRWKWWNAFLWVEDIVVDNGRQGRVARDFHGSIT